MSLLKKLKNLIPKRRKSKTQKLPTVFLNRFNKPNKLTQKRTLEKISKRTFKKNAPINFLGKLKQISKWMYLAIFLAILIALVYSLFFTNTFNVKKILIYEGEEESTNIQLRRITEPLRNRNIILFSKNDLETLIQNRIDNITALEIVKQYPDTVVIRYDRFSDVANITNLIGRLQVRKSFILNENGILIEEDKISSTLPNITIQTEAAYNLGEQIIDPEQLKFILDTKNYFEERFDLKIIDIRYIPRAREIRLTTERDFEVWIDLAFDYREQINKLRNAVPRINVYEGPLEYVDLRIRSAEGQKIIYK